MLNFRNRFLLIIEAWRSELASRSFRFKIFLLPRLFIIYSAITQRLNNYIETRKGLQLVDKLLTFFPSIDFSTAIFLLLYGSLFLLITTHLSKPKIIVRIVEMHFLVAVVRQICILMVALEPPAGLIVLRDVFLENTVYPHNSPLTKDLFFSGHVASIWIYFLCAQQKYLKGYFMCAALLMSFMVLSMRIHYTYDVYGGIFFTTLIFFTPRWIRSYYLRLKEQPIQ
jgi:hypothetical protein